MLKLDTRGKKKKKKKKKKEEEEEVGGGRRRRRRKEEEGEEEGGGEEGGGGGRGGREEEGGGGEKEEAEEEEEEEGKTGAVLDHCVRAVRVFPAMQPVRQTGHRTASSGDMWRSSVWTRCLLPYSLSWISACYSSA